MTDVWRKPTRAPSGMAGPCTHPSTEGSGPFTSLRLDLRAGCECLPRNHAESQKLRLKAACGAPQRLGGLCILRPFPALSAQSHACLPRSWDDSPGANTQLWSTSVSQCALLIGSVQGWREQVAKAEGRVPQCPRQATEKLAGRWHPSQ